MWGWTMGKDETLGTIWEVPDHLWEQMVIARPRVLGANAPKADAGIIFRRSGCQWNRLPRELGDDSTIHRTFQRWVDWSAVWAVQGCEELGGVDWEWQSADCSMGKAAPLRNPTDRGKAGSKKSILVDSAGGPLSVGGWSQRP